MALGHQLGDLVPVGAVVEHHADDGGWRWPRPGRLRRRRARCAASWTCVPSLPAHADKRLACSRATAVPPPAYAAIMVRLCPSSPDRSSLKAKEGGGRRGLHDRGGRSPQEVGDARGDRRPGQSVGDRQVRHPEPGLPLDAAVRAPAVVHHGWAIEGAQGVAGLGATPAGRRPAGQVDVVGRGARGGRRVTARWPARLFSSRWTTTDAESVHVASNFVHLDDIDTDNDPAPTPTRSRSTFGRSQGLEPCRTSRRSAPRVERGHPDIQFEHPAGLGTCKLTNCTSGGPRSYPSTVSRDIAECPRQDSNLRRTV